MKKKKVVVAICFNLTQLCERCGRPLWTGHPEYRQGRVITTHVVCPPKKLSPSVRELEMAQ